MCNIPECPEYLNRNISFCFLVPCVPDNITAVSSCEDNGAIVTWGHSPVASSYQLTATGVDGHTAVCNASVNNCTLADLHCGQLYNFSITASGDNCTSYPRTTIFRTGINTRKQSDYTNLKFTNFKTLTKNPPIAAVVSKKQSIFIFSI